MPYVYCNNATTWYGDFRFPAERIDGNWVGWAKVSDDKAKFLVENYPGACSIITEKEFDSQKKKEREQPQAYRTLSPREARTGNTQQSQGQPAEPVEKRSEKTAEELIELVEIDGDG